MSKSDSNISNRLASALRVKMEPTVLPTYKAYAISLIPSCTPCKATDLLKSKVML